MKKYILWLSLVLLVFPLQPESGRWKLEPLFTRLADGTLIPADMAYSHPYLGIEELEFLDDFLVRIAVGGGEHRSFYDFIPTDAGNRQMVLTFKDGRELHIQTVAREDGFLFFYELPEGFFDMERFETPPELPVPEEISDNEQMDGAEPEFPEVWQICGRLIKEDF